MESWIKSVLEQFGAAGVGFLMVIENIFPPIPSELVMPWAGYAVRQGDASFLAMVSAGSLGSFIGASLWYLVAKWVGCERLSAWVEKHGWWITLTKADIDATVHWFDRWGGIAVLLCRLIPGIRTLISVPAGFSEMSVRRFSLYTAIGTVAWTTLLCALGWWLADNYAQLAGPLSWVSMAVVGGLLGWWLYRLVTQAHRRYGKVSSSTKGRG